MVVSLEDLIKEAVLSNIYRGEEDDCVGHHGGPVISCWPEVIF